MMLTDLIIGLLAVTVSISSTLLMMMSCMLSVSMVLMKGSRTRECLGVNIKMTRVGVSGRDPDGTGHLPGTD